jgi:hypothetical protein
MRWFLHPHRTDVLSACALVTRAHEPIVAGLARLGSGDPFLKRWAQRLAPGLEDGQPLPLVLCQTRVISRQEADLLSAEADLPAALDRLVVTSTRPSYRNWVIRHLPSVIVMAVMVPALLMSTCFLSVVQAFEQIYRDLNIDLPAATIAVLHPLTLLATLVGSLLMIGCCEWLLRALSGVRFICLLWCPEVERQTALLRLIQAARTGEQAPPDLGWMRRQLSALRLGASSARRPRWQPDWNIWMLLTRFRLDRTLRRAAAPLPDLASRLVVLRVIPLRNDQPDWDAAEQRCRERLDRAESQAFLFISVVLLWASCISLIVSLLGPLFRIIEEVGKQS